MEMDNAVLQSIPDVLQECLDYKNVTIKREVTGGIVNKAALVDTDRGPKFVKYSSRQNAFDMFSSEMESLRMIKETRTVHVPETVKCLSCPEGGAVLVMEYISDLQPLTDQWEQLGHKVAKMHKHNLDLLTNDQKTKSSVHKQSASHPVEKFGFPSSIYFGPDFCIPAATWLDSWEDYFARMMLQPQFEEIQQKTGRHEFSELWSDLSLHLHKVFRHVNNKPSLLHGDFCSINVGQTMGEAVVFDPCSMYGPAEHDFTIPDMEKDFHQGFYDSYHKVIPQIKERYDMRSQARLLFAQLLISNVQSDANMIEDAIVNAKELIAELKSTS